jgi:DNA-binding MarR family transcriptional regulator
MTEGHDIAMSLRAAYWAMHRRADSYLARYGVTADQFVLLAALAEGDGITQQELVRRTSSDPNTIRPMLRLLEGRELVSRVPHPTDGRARSVCLTRKGRRAFEELWARSEPFRANLTRVFQREEIGVLLALLRRVTEALPPVTGRRRRTRLTPVRA